MSRLSIVAKRTVYDAFEELAQRYNYKNIKYSPKLDYDFKNMIKNHKPKPRRHNCALCERDESFTINSFKKGEWCMSGPYNGLWVHPICAIMAPLVTRKSDNTFSNLEAEIERGKSMMCLKCNKAGAVCECSYSSCSRSYHLPCAIEAGSTIKSHKLLCKQHSKHKTSESHILPLESHSSKRHKASNNDLIDTSQQMDNEFQLQFLSTPHIVSTDSLSIAPPPKFVSL